jgi:hypothetical protein
MINNNKYIKEKSIKISLKTIHIYRETVNLLKIIFQILIMNRRKFFKIIKNINL